MSYTVSSYGQMLRDDVRMSAYMEALQKHLKPGMTVLDLGAGPCFFSILACQLGARHVYAIDLNPAILLGRDLAQDNGMADRITCYHKPASEVTLPEKVDLLIFDLRGVLPLTNDCLSVIGEARDRFLKPGGIMLPERDELWAVPVHAPELHRTQVRPWHDLAVDMNLDRWAVMNANALLFKPIEEAHFGAEPQLLADLDYRTTTGGGVDRTLTFECTDDRPLHGFQVWFKVMLCDGIEYDGRTAREHPVYGFSYFPWPASVSLQSGDRIDARIAARVLDGDFIWIWETTIRRPDGSVSERFEQSTDDFMTIDLDSLRRISPSAKPGLNLRGKAAMEMLRHINEGLSVGETAQRAMESHPDVFADLRSATRHVQVLLRSFEM